MKKVIVQNDQIFSEVTKLVSEGGNVTLKTKGNSMLPFIRGGRDSVVLVKADEIKLYDIVLAALGGIAAGAALGAAGAALTSGSKLREG